MRGFALAILLLSVAAAGAMDDIHGDRLPAPGSDGRPAVIFFVLKDCPVSNRFAPEMNRICDDYEDRGVRCTLAYVDPDLTVAEIERHLSEYSHGIRAVYDRDHEMVKATGATVTPEAVLFDGGGRVVYRGRINNFYAKLGVPRRQVTEHDLRDALDAVLAGRPVKNPRTEAVGCYIPDLAAIRGR